MGFWEASTATKVADVLAFVAFLLNIVGFGAPHWSKGEIPGVGVLAKDEGLWMYCTPWKCSGWHSDCKYMYMYKNRKRKFYLWRKKSMFVSLTHQLINSRI